MPDTMFEYYAENAVFFKTILGLKGDPAFASKLKEILKELFQKNLDLEQLKEDDMPIPPDFFVSYITSANIGLLEQWFKTGMIKTPRKIHFALANDRVNRCG